MYRYLIEEQEANNQAAALAASLKENTGKSNFVGFAVNVIIRRLKTSPKQYREYGMYWPALKQLLNANEAGFGDDEVDAEIAGIYRFESPAALIAAAESFKDEYRNTWFVGNNEFVIDDNGRKWTLYDDDMELRA